MTSDPGGYRVLVSVDLTEINDLKVFTTQLSVSLQLILSSALPKKLNDRYNERELNCSVNRKQISE